MKKNSPRFISILSSITLASSLLVIGSTSTPEASATEDLPVALQLGESFVGEEEYEGLGWSVDSSDDGSIVAMGGQTHGTTGEDEISFKVFEYATLEQKWLSYGSAIDIPVSSYLDVSYLSLSSDGKVMAVGVPSFESGGDRTGLARVYEFTNGDWQQKGQDITGAAGSRTGGSVAIDSSGNRMAVAIPNPTSSQALVRIYDYQAGSWVLEEEITFDMNQTVLDEEGVEVDVASDSMNLSISNDGKTIAVAGVSLDQDAIKSDTEVAATIQVWQEEGNGNSWAQLGGDFYVERYLTSDLSSGDFVSLSGDGNRLAIGENWDDLATTYEFLTDSDNPDGAWVPVGQELILDESTEGFAETYYGTSVSLNYDGSKIAVGSNVFLSNPESRVELYELKSSVGGLSWVPSNNPITKGDYSSEIFSYSLALSDDGDRFIVGDSGSPMSAENPNGIARVYSSLGIDPEGRTDPASNVLIATMYERHASFDIVTNDEEAIGTFSGDEYFYRIAKGSENNVVDMQSTAGLEQLSYGEQEDYYNIGWFFSEEDPYEFLWYVALCEDLSDGTLSQPLNVQTGFQQPLLLPTEQLNGDSLVQFWEVANSSDVTPLQTIQTLKNEGGPQTSQPVNDGETAFPLVERNGADSEYEMRSSEAYLQYDCLPGALQIPYPILDEDGNEINSRELDLEDDHYIDTGVLEQIDLEGMYVAVFGDGGEQDSIAGTVAHFGVTKAQSTSYNISYHPNGASSGSLPDDQSVAAGDFTPPGNTGSLERPGFEFIGWSDDFTENIAEYPLSITTNTRLYAIWEALPGNNQSDNSDPNQPSSGFSPGPYSGPIITTVGFGPETTYSSLSNTPVVVSGQRLSGITKATVGNRDATVVNSTSDSFTMLIPEGLAPGTYNLKIETPLGNLNYLAAITIADVSYGEVSAWTKRISDTEAKVYVKYPTVGEKVRISYQTGGSGSYESVYVKTTSSETMEGLRVVEGVGTYIVRTINLSDINRIRVTVGDQEMVQVRYNN